MANRSYNSNRCDQADRNRCWLDQQSYNGMKTGKDTSATNNRKQKLFVLYTGIQYNLANLMFRSET